MSRVKFQPCEGALDEHLLVFCGCVETEMFLPALRYIHEQFLKQESVDYQQVAKLLPPEAGAYALLTLLDNRNIITHGGSIRYSFTGHPPDDDPKPLHQLEAIILECTDGCQKCPIDCNCVIEYTLEGPPQKRCRECDKIVKETKQ